MVLIMKCDDSREYQDGQFSVLGTVATVKLDELGLEEQASSEQQIQHKI